jgi:hypothetical protein
MRKLYLIQSFDCFLYITLIIEQESKLHSINTGWDK